MVSRSTLLLSVNTLTLAERPQTDEPDLPQHLRLNDFSREPNFPSNSGFVPNEELAKAAELQRKSIRAQMVEQSGLQAPNHSVNDVLGPVSSSAKIGRSDKDGPELGSATVATT